MEELFLIEYYIDNICLKCTMMKGVEEEDVKLNVDLDFAKFASIQVRQEEFDFDILEYDTDDDDCEIPPFEMEGSLKECDSTDEAYVEESEAKENELQLKKKFRCGASVLFANTINNVIQLFKKFPLEIFVYTTNEFEKKTCLGVSRVRWNSDIWEFLEKNKCSCPQEARLTWLTTEPLMCEESGIKIGEITFGVRVTILGRSVKTKFKNCLCKIEPMKGKKSFSCNLYGVSIKKRKDSLNRTYQKSGYVEYLVKLIKQILKAEAADASSGKNNCSCESVKVSTKKKDEGCACTAGCGKPGTCPLQPMQQYSEGMKVDVRQNGQCHGCPGCGTICPGRDEESENMNTLNKKLCTGPCNKARDVCLSEMTSAQNLVYEGLAAMLRTVKDENHRRFCPEYIRKGTCPTGACIEGAKTSTPPNPPNPST